MKNRFMGTCVPGAEAVLKEEIDELLHEKNNLFIDRGKVFFDSRQEISDIMRIKCADNIYRLINKFKIGPHKADLQNFYKNIVNTDYGGIYSGEKKKMTVSASRTGKHTYSRYDLSETAACAMESTGYFILGDEKNHDIAFRIDVKEGVCLFSIKLTLPEFRFRGVNFHSSKGGIRPTAAHCLVRLSRPENNDVFYDPFCGAGTIPFERASFKFKKIFASDIDDKAVDTARSNLGSDIILFKADAADTIIKSGSVDTVVTNMPWGKQITASDINKLYYGFIGQLKRILKASGKAVILTNQCELLKNACDSYNFSLTRSLELSLHGMHPSVFILKNK